jgi:hypothetical protein
MPPLCSLELRIPIQLARFSAVALAEDTLLCKAKQQRSRWSSAKPEVNVADGFGAEAYF